MSTDPRGRSNPIRTGGALTFVPGLGAPDSLDFAGPLIEICV